MWKKRSSSVAKSKQFKAWEMERDICRKKKIVNLCGIYLSFQVVVKYIWELQDISCINDFGTVWRVICPAREKAHGMNGEKKGEKKNYIKKGNKIFCLSPWNKKMSIYLCIYRSPDDVISSKGISTEQMMIFIVIVSYLFTIHLFFHENKSFSERDR